MIKISAIIPSFDRAEELLRCLASLAEMERPGDLEVIVVDNGSSDGTPGLVRAQHPGVHVIRNPRNLGASRAKNQGALQAAGEVLWFLDSDTVVPSGAVLDAALALLESGPGVGAVGGEVYRRQDGSLEWRQKVLQLNAETRTISHQDGYGGRLTVDYLPSCNLFVRRELFQEVGGFDPDYFFLMEDTDLCVRLARLGYACLASDETAVEHRLVLRGRKGDFFLGHRNRIRFALLNLPAWQVAALPLLDLAYAVSPYKVEALLGGRISADKHLSPSLRAMGNERAMLPFKVCLAGADYFISLARGYLWNVARLGQTVGLRRAPRRSFL